MPLTVIFSVLLGWTAIVLLVATAVLPYLVRNNQLSRALGGDGSSSGPFLERMSPHAWLGYAIAALAGLHSLAALLAGGIARFDAVGLWFATAALVLLGAQWVLGSRLMQRALAQRRLLRRWHFGVMLCMSAAIFAHAYLNGALLRSMRP